MYTPEHNGTYRNKIEYNIEYSWKALRMSYMIPDRLRFPVAGERYTPEQVIQQSIEAYMNGGRHGNDAAREPLAEFIANELRLHGMGWGSDLTPT